jgi:3-oxosteroid 1-dehydrogenase
VAVAEVPARWDLEVDVACVGSGLGAVTAAIRAHDAGARAVILEKAPKLGGVCAYSGGEVFVPDNYKMRELGIPDSEEAGRAYLRFLGGGYADERMQRLLYDTGREAARWLGEHAKIPWKPIAGFPDYHYPHAPGTVAGGRYLRSSSSTAPASGRGRRRATRRRTCRPGSPTTSCSRGEA